MAGVTLEHLSKSYGSVMAVDDVSLEVRDGELLALLGPSGCGKTTTLRMIAGFVAPSSGRILIGKRDVTDVPPNKRNTGMVFQRYALFPHMTVEGNVAFGLEMRKLPRDEIRARVAAALRLVRLEGFGERLPRELSGGQQQRVALARGLVIRPDVFLLDEPLSNLDAKLRHEVRIEIRELQQRLGLTTIFVTHDQEEALVLADRLALMNRGVVQQIGSPAELYEKPVNLFVADFIGKTNFFRGRVVGDDRFRSDGGLVMRFAPDAASAGATVLGVRPERVRLGETDGLANSFTGRVALATYLGAGIEYEIALEGGERLRVERPNTGAAALAPVGTELRVGWDAAACLLLRDDGREAGPAPWPGRRPA